MAATITRRKRVQRNHEETQDQEYQQALEQIGQTMPAVRQLMERFPQAYITRICDEVAPDDWGAARDAWLQAIQQGQSRPLLACNDMLCVLSLLTFSAGYFKGQQDGLLEGVIQQVGRPAALAVATA